MIHIQSHYHMIFKSEKATKAALVTIDENSRQTIADQIDAINTCHTTCLACGLEEGLNVRKMSLSLI